MGACALVIDTACATISMRCMQSVHAQTTYAGRRRPVHGRVPLRNAALCEPANLTSMPLVAGARLRTRARAAFAGVVYSAAPRAPYGCSGSREGLFQGVSRRHRHDDRVPEQGG
eukprot:6212891-Pleurochrysis_carterae.AAC.3